MRVAIYSRKSKLSEKGESISNQIEMCREYAVRNFGAGENDITIYEDEGYSGKDTDRPGFNRMMDAAGNGLADVVICYRLDRISRNVGDFSATLDILNRNNVAFVSVTERFDTSNPLGRAMMYISSVFAQLERETTAERVRDNLRRLARGGRWLGGTPPTGYVAEEVVYSGGAVEKKRMKRLAPVSGELQVVKVIYEKYIELASMSRLYLWLAENGVRTRKGGIFCKRALRIILENPVYVRADGRVREYFISLGCDVAGEPGDFNSKNGLLAYGRRDQSVKGKNLKRPEEDWVVAAGAHEGVIEPEHWLRVQKRLCHNAKKAPREGQGEYSLLNSLIVCGVCGSGMSVSFREAVRKDGTAHYYYRCRRKNDSRGVLCSVGNVCGRAADEAVLAELRRLNGGNDGLLLEQVIKRKEEKFGTIVAKNEKSGRLQREIKSLRGRIESLTGMLEGNENKSAAKYIIERIELYDEEISKLERELKAEATSENACTAGIDADFIRQIYEFPAKIDMSDVKSAKIYVQAMVKAVLWDGFRLQISLRN